MSSAMAAIPVTDPAPRLMNAEDFWNYGQHPAKYVRKMIDEASDDDIRALAVVENLPAGATVSDIREALTGLRRAVVKPR